MKNKLLQSKIFFTLIFSLSFLCNNLFSKEVNIKATEILTYEKGNIIVGNNEVEAKIDSEVEIFADKITYNKKEGTLIAEGNVRSIDLINEIEIKSQKSIFYKNKNHIITIGETFFKINKDYKGQSSDVYFYINEKIIFSKKLSNFNDSFNNSIQVSSFRYSNTSQVLKANDIELIDNKKNKYFLEKGFLKTEENILIGKDIKISLRNDTFGLPDNEPKLKGNSVVYQNDKTIIKKGIFTSCKDNNECPPWVITSKEIVHDRKKREIQYKNAWLKIYNIPVLYFPKFFHPDPTVDRKSGFLMPAFSESNNLGTSVKIPYFYAISDSQDLTFKPRFFSNNEFLLQSEYRKEDKNSSHIFDFSLNKTNSDSEKGRNIHFFSNSKFILDETFFSESSIDLKIEKVSNDNYLNLYSIENSSPIINDTSVLENIIEFSGSQNNFYLDLSLESYETLDKPNSDRYEFVYPNYSLKKINFFDDKLINSFEFSSSGNQKKHSTNVYEAVQINDFLFNGANKISNIGFNHNFKTIIKNVNSDGKNSTKLKDKSQSEVLSMITYDIDLPLIKNNNNFNNLLTPKMSFRFSPNDTKNLKNESRYLNSDNIFSLNRIGYGDTIESGTSLTLGLDYDKKHDKSNNTFLSSKIATVFRDEINENLPITSTLGEKQSDFVGEISFIPFSNFELDYNYSLNDDLNEINLHNFENTFRVNNFVNTFSFYEENNLIGDKSYYENKFSYNFDQKNSLSFKTRNNKKNNLTEFYNLIYQYKTDCLVASIRYNKEYYSSNTKKPNEELFFNITLIPLGSTQTESIID